MVFLLAAIPRVKTAIIGSGPCGLGAAWRLEELARLGLPNSGDWALVDSAPESGGLASSVVDPQGFTWDMGGHVIFSHYAYFSRLLDALLPPSEWNQLEREAWVWMRNRFIPYPFQQNLHRLPKEDVTKCLNGIIDIEKQRSSFKKPANFAEWLAQSFGNGLCEVFMTPYNKKVSASTRQDTSDLNDSRARSHLMYAMGFALVLCVGVGRTTRSR